MHIAQYVGDPQLLAGTGATVDVQPGRLGEGSLQRCDGQGAGQGEARLRSSCWGRALPPGLLRQRPPSPASLGVNMSWAASLGVNMLLVADAR